MVDTWQPTTNLDSISTEKLAELASIITDKDEAKTSLKQLNEDDINLISNCINTPQDAWIMAIKPLSVDQILNLCTLFTIGEMAFPNWAFTSKNPTIYFLRYLKLQKIVVEKDFIRWLKKNTDNRYIPYGPAL
jgi:hypothetical protein